MKVLITYLLLTCECLVCIGNALANNFIALFVMLLICNIVFTFIAGNNQLSMFPRVKLIQANSV